MRRAVGERHEAHRASQAYDVPRGLAQQQLVGELEPRAVQPRGDAVDDVVLGGAGHRDFIASVCTQVFPLWNIRCTPVMPGQNSQPR